MLALNNDISSEYINIKKNLTDKLGGGIIKYLNINENGVPPVAAKLGADGSLKPVVNKYMLDHRILESLLILYRTTHEQKYREAAWKLFVSVNSTCRTDYGFSGVEIKPGGECERLEGEVDPRVFSGFFKYMYLIFSDSTFVDLDKWVFTPEGHPLLKIEKWAPTVDSEVFTIGDRTTVF
jgi:mannosyl-oligosaccharide alpha-1,2-mannosidase